MCSTTKAGGGEEPLGVGVSCAAVWAAVGREDRRQCDVSVGAVETDEVECRGDSLECRGVGRNLRGIRRRDELQELRGDFSGALR